MSEFGYYFKEVASIYTWTKGLKVCITHDSDDNIILFLQRILFF